MDALALVLISGACLLIAYMTYGRWLSRRVFQLDDSVDTPATTERDGRDYVPTPKSIIFGHHFTSIAGTGPIVGPAIAVMWGWLPAILWVVIGAIFVGAVHDLGAIVVSLRKKGRSIGDIAGDLLGPRARLIFLCILIVGLWIVLAVFGLVIAAVLKQYPAAVFPVLVQIPLAIGIGLFVHKHGKSIVIPSILALALMYASVIWGDVGLLGLFNQTLAAQPIILWVGFLLAYAYVASVLPVWVLLQPRDYINALQLITALALITVGLLAAATLGGASDPSPLPLGGGQGEGIDSPFSIADAPLPSPLPEGEGVDPSSSSADPSFPSASSVPSVVNVERPQLELVAPMIDWTPVGAPPLLPVLFITIACGACSGFHCLVGSGTTSKQIAKETDAKVVGYGAMLTEGFLATLVIAACAAGIGMGASLTFDTFKGGSSISSSPGASADLRQWESRVRVGGIEEVIVWADIEVIGESDASGRWSFEQHVRDSGVRAFGGAQVQENAGVWSVVNEGEIQIGPDPFEYSATGHLAFKKQYESWSAAGSLGAKVGAFVEGSANFVASLGIARDIAIALMAVMVASFAATTMDTACRLQRYVIQELSSTFLPRVRRCACVACGYDLSGHLDGGTALRAVSERATGQSPVPPRSITCPECGRDHPAHEVYHHDRDASWKLARPINPFKWLATVHGATLFAVVTALALATIPPAGQSLTIDSAGRGALILWPLFGATNQLLAGFAFIVIVAWLIATKRPRWFAIPPAVIMLVIPAAAMTWQAFIGNADNPSWLSGGKWLLVSISVITLALEAWLVIETVARWFSARPSWLGDESEA